jgi:mannose-6-phosphate isomerase-like protein (cupin superfamily)
MSYTIINILSVEDSAPKFGFGELGSARFVREDVEAQDTGLAYHVLRPGRRQAFGHRHDQAEEVSVVLSGSGRVRLDDEIVELKTMDAIRISPKVTRAFEAGDDGLEWLVFGPHHAKDGELDPEFWKD